MGRKGMMRGEKEMHTHKVRGEKGWWGSQEWRENEGVVTVK